MIGSRPELRVGFVAFLSVLGLGALGAAGLARGAPQVDPAKVVMFSKEHAKDLAVAFVTASEPFATEEQPTVDGDLTEGLFNRFYTVSSAMFFANVDAHDGRVISLVIARNVPTTEGNVLTSDQALAAARSFLEARDVPFADLAVSVAWREHGEASEWIVSWERRENGVVVPDSRVVGINAATGAVFRYSDLRHAYKDPGSPVVARETAIDAAIDASGLGKAATITSSELRLSFDSKGNQHLVWWISIQAPIEPTADAPALTNYALIEVDAVAGSTVVLGRG